MSTVDQKWVRQSEGQRAVYTQTKYCIVALTYLDRNNSQSPALLLGKTEFALAAETVFFFTCRSNPSSFNLLSISASGQLFYSGDSVKSRCCVYITIWACHKLLTAHCFKYVGEVWVYFNQWKAFMYRLEPAAAPRIQWCRTWHSRYLECIDMKNLEYRLTERVGRWIWQLERWLKLFRSGACSEQKYWSWSILASGGG